MNKRFEDFNAAMRGVDAPPSAQDATRKAIAAARVNAAHAASTRGAAAHGPRPLGWYVAAGCAVAAVALVALGLSGIVTSTSTQGDDGVATAPAAPNSFTLAAYAGEVPLAGTEEMAMESGGWSAVLADMEIPLRTETLRCDLALNLTCTGSNIKTLTYQIEGDGIALALHKEIKEEDEDGPYYRTDVTVSNTWKTTPEELEDYPESDTLPYVRVKFEKTEEIKQALNRVNELEGQYPYKFQGDDQWKAIPDDVKQAMQEAHEDLDMAVRTAAAECMSEATLNITATFTDGSKQTHSYRIAPVKDFEERLRNNNNWGDGTSLLLTVEQLS